MKKKKISYGQITLHIIFLLLSVCFIIPLIYTVSISFSDEGSLMRYGYQLIPRQFSAEAYKLLFKSSGQLLQSYKITIFYSVIATGLSLIVMSMFAYPLTRENCIFNKFMVKFILITMLFNGGLVPTYILNTKYLHLDNTIWIYLLPSLLSCWNVIIIRTNFKNIPYSLIESAKLDGASELCILFRIIMPLSIPALAAVGFLILVPKWNDWNTSLLYITEPKLYSLQYMLQKILREADFLKQMAQSGQEFVDVSQIPTESFKYAIALVTAGPMLIVFPFFEKYFVRGLTVGSVKG